MEQTCLWPSDGKQLLKVRRQCTADVLVVEPIKEFAFCALKSESVFIPSSVFDMLCKSYPDINQLIRLLKQDWVKAWSGWKEISSKLDAKGKKKCSAEIIHDCILSFTSKCMEAFVFRYPSDTVRMRDLRKENNLVCGATDGLAWNSLCDSLLQVLLANKMVSVHVVNRTSRLSLPEWRRRMCARVRQFLCNHNDTTLRPQAQKPVNELKDTTCVDESIFLGPHKLSLIHI